MKNILRLIYFITLLQVGCRIDKDDVRSPVKPDDSELITTVIISFTDTAGANKTFYKYSDVDGPGGNIPIIDTISLDHLKGYNAKLILLNESKTPADTISNEVLERAEEHQVFYAYFPDDSSAMFFSYKDSDLNNVPVGLQFEVSFIKPGKGKMQIILKHQPGTKPRSGNGNQALGSTDLDIIFPVKLY